MSIFAGIGPALLGGALGLIGNQQQADAMEEAYEGFKQPVWDPRQIPYLFGDTGYQFNMPQATDEGLAHGLALMGGYNPAQGGAMQAPMDTSYLMQNLLGPQMGQSQAPQMGQAPQPAGMQMGQAPQPAGMQMLLGYGAPTAPAFMTSSPYYQGEQPVQTPPGQLLGGPSPQRMPLPQRWQANSPFASSYNGSGYDWIGH